MARTDAAEVGKIIAVEDGKDISPFIDVANELVTECCVGEGLSDTRLVKIETWLAAHFYAIYDPRAASETAAGVGEKIESKVDLGFNVTRYGQMAMRLDTSGSLAALDANTLDGKTQSIAVNWLGTETDEDADDEE